MTQNLRISNNSIRSYRKIEKNLPNKKYEKIKAGFKKRIKNITFIAKFSRKVIFTFF